MNLDRARGTLLVLACRDPLGRPVEFASASVISAEHGQLDEMIDEYVAFASVDHRHSYEDVPGFELTAYSLEEIFAEKLRALYQRSHTRDYYDLYRMLTEADVDDSVIRPAFTRKCEHDGLNIDLQDGLPREKRDEIRDGWQNTLPDWVADLPEFGPVYNTLKDYVDSLVNEQ